MEPRRLLGAHTWALACCLLLVAAATEAAEPTTPRPAYLDRLINGPNGAWKNLPDLIDDSGIRKAMLSSEYVANGREALPYEFPSFAHLTTFGQMGYGSCGSVLIDRQHLLTVAHCVRDVDEFNVTFSNRVNHYPKELSFLTRTVCVPPGFYDDYRSFDYAVVKLQRPLSFNQRIRPACLPEAPLEVGDPVVAVGQGGTKRIGRGTYAFPTTLQRLDMAMVYCPALEETNVICFSPSAAAGGTGDTCPGDSGSPIYSIVDNRQTVVALTSHGQLYCDPKKKGLNINVDLYVVREDLQQMLDNCRAHTRE